MEEKDSFKLVKQVLNGDIKSFEHIIKNYELLVFNIINSKMPFSLKYLVEDIAQEVFARIFFSLSSYNKKYSFVNWVYTITLNVVKDFIKKEKKEKIKYIVQSEKESLYYDSKISENEKTKVIRNLINDLPIKYQKVLFFYYNEEKGIKEISEILNVNENTVKTWLSRAKNKIEKELRKLKLFTE